jgi:hypothetical protein
MNINRKEKKKIYQKKSTWITAGAIVLLIVGVLYIKNNSKEFAISSLNVFQKVTKILPISPDTKKEVEVVNDLVAKYTAQDNVERTFLLLLQNNYELRPGGGFLGQYAIIKVKNGEVLSTKFEDANILDQSLDAKVTPPYALTRKLQLKKWKFRDSNFSPDYPTNVEKALYFYRLAGRGSGDQFDGVIAVNADVFNHVLELTGPITPSGYNTTFTKDDGARKLEEVVEKSYLGENVSAEAKQARKNIMKVLTAELSNKLMTLGNIPKIAELGLAELRNKNVMVWVRDETIQKKIAEVKWDGAVNQAWDKDYLMFVDANLGGLKTDYYVERSIDYTVDFTTGGKPFATAVYTYNNKAPRADWQTTDYHTFVRLYVPKGSVYKDRFMINAVTNGEDLGHYFMGGYVDAAIGQGDVTTTLKYELPDTIKPENYELLIQKQSGIKPLPVHIKLITANGAFEQESEIIHDTTFQFQETDEKK